MPTHRVSAFASQHPTPKPARPAPTPKTTRPAPYKPTNFFFSQKHQQMQYEAHGPPLPGQCHCKITYNGLFNEVYGFNNGLVKGEKINCHNNARNGSRYCSSHRKLDTPEEAAEVIRLQAKLKMDREMAKEMAKIAKEKYKEWQNAEIKKAAYEERSK